MRRWHVGLGLSVACAVIGAGLLLEQLADGGFH